MVACFLHVIRTEESKNIIRMEQTIKQFYEAPSTTVFEVRQEGVLCASVMADPISDPFSGLEELEW